MYIQSYYMWPKSNLTSFIFPLRRDTFSIENYNIIIEAFPTDSLVIISRNNYMNCSFHLFLKSIVNL